MKQLYYLKRRISSGQYVRLYSTYEKGVSQPIEASWSQEHEPSLNSSQESHLHDGNAFEETTDSVK